MATMTFQNTLALVTGGAGFIGSHLVQGLLDAGAEVRVIDDFSTGSRANLESVEGRVDVHEASITELAACTAACEGASWVFHEAALTSVMRSVRDPGATHDVCATGTLNMLRAAQAAGVRRFVYDEDPQEDAEGDHGLGVHLDRVAVLGVEVPDETGTGHQPAGVVS